MPIATRTVSVGKGNFALKRRVAMIGMDVAFLIGDGGMFAGMSLYGVNTADVTQTISRGKARNA